MASSNIGRLWADLIVEELVRCGVDFFCLAPGSRSTPLTTAVAAHPMARHVMHFDERGTAFCALGYARATGRPAAWITTSGTAVANGLPAVVEAATDGVPMLLVTADRPPELRETGANQTIDQVKLFGAYVRWQFDLPVPAPEVDPAVVLTTVDQAVYRARRTPGGPVHLNCMFREPLTPDGDDRSDDRGQGAYLEALAPWRARPHAYTQYAQPRSIPDDGEVERLWRQLRGVARGLVVAGRLGSPAEADAVRWLAETLGWPLLPDAGSHLRLGGGRCAVLAPYYDLMLASEAFRVVHPPEAVLHVGGRPTSKRLAQYLDAARPDPYVVVRDDPFRFDPAHRVTCRIEADVVAFCEALVRKVQAAPPPPPGEWLAAWQAGTAKTAARLDACFAGRNVVDEPGVARLVSRHLPEGHGLFVASSMPVRDLDAFAVPDGAPARVAANRGVSGIDGTVAAAAGFAMGLQAPVTLLVGDLALLHDLNTLALLPRLPVPVTVVAVNNHGGGIFSFLPIARHADVFEPFFGTPHDVTFEKAAALFGLSYAAPATPGAFVEAYRAAAGTSPALVEVTTDRHENVARHRALLDEVREALSS